VSIVYISLGSNQGDRRQVLRAALRRLRGLGTSMAVSPLYRTIPVGVERARYFLNAVAQLKTALGPMTLLRQLQTIERDFGRRRKSPRWSRRTLDLDILFYGNAIIETPRLTVPHPRLTQRLFVLKPLARLAPDMAMPLSDRTIKDCLQSIADPFQAVTRID